ncbi:MAG: hypothetical protein R6U89_08485 [Dehalococcoidia bacterium]
MKWNISLAVLITLVLPALLLSQTDAYAGEDNSENSIQLGEYQVEYDEYALDDFDGDGLAELTLYYSEGILVASAEDTNADGEPDFWLRYTPDWYADMEIRDRDFDGEPDVFIFMDENERILNVEKTGGGKTTDGGMETAMVAVYSVAGIIVASVAAFVIYNRSRKMRHY